VQCAGAKFPIFGGVKISIDPFSANSLKENDRPAGIRRHGQGGTCSPLCIRGLVTVKRSVNELFMHYFHNLLSGSKPPDPTGALSLDPSRGISSPVL